MAAHRYWRIYITASAASGYVSIMELQLRTSIGGSNVATGGTASASSTGFGWSASNAFNGSTASPGWHSGTNALPGTPEWLKYDLGSGNDKDVIEFAISARGSNPEQNPRDFQLQYSDDNSAWTTLYTIGGETSWDSSGTYIAYSADDRPDDPGVNGRFWRLRSTAVDGGTVLALAELLMFVSGSATNQCTGGSAYSSSYKEGHDDEAFDGTLADTEFGNYWASQVVASWVGYKFPTAKTINRIGISARINHQDQSPKDFVVEYWDGSAYQTAMTLTGITGWTSGQLRYFDATGEVGPPSAGGARPVVFVCT